MILEVSRRRTFLISCIKPCGLKTKDSKNNFKSIIRSSLPTGDKHSLRTLFGFNHLIFKGMMKENEP